MHELSSSSVDTKVYRLAGLRVASEVPLSGLALEDLGEPGEVVTIRYARVPTALSDSVTVENGIAYNGRALLIAVPKVGRYLVRDGREILVDPDSSADINDLRAYLMGSAFGTLCHQRGLLPLHSATIDIANGCAAFIGFSGAGKSTLAATLAARGHQVISDDVSFLWRDSDDRVMSWPGIGQIRLWEDAATELGCNAPGVEREFRGYNKYLIPVRPPPDPFAARRLCRIYHLSTAPGGSTAHVIPVRGAAAIELLMQNIYGSSFSECMGLQVPAFAFCATVARQVPVFQFSRPLDFAALHHGVEILEKHLGDGQYDSVVF